MHFHWGQHAEITLHTTRVVVVDIVCDHLDELLFTGKAPAVITFPFQNAPEALHRSIVNTMRYARHALCHTGLLQLVVKSPVGILEASVTVEQRVGIRIRLDSLVKGLVDKRIVISLAEHIGHDAPVTEVQDSAQIELVYSDPLVPFELSHIGQPFLVGLFCVELTVQKILCNELRIFGMSGTAVVTVLHCRAYISGPADPQHPLVIDMDTIVVTKIIVEPSIALIRAFLMDLFDFVGQTLIFLGSAAQLSRIPFVVS